MKVCVLVKGVPDASASRRVDSATGRLDRTVESGLNTYDRYPLETALQMREASVTETEVVAVTMGPPSADRTLRRALALGADRAVHLCDEALTGSDAAATGYALAQLLRSEDPDLVLTGERSSDAGTSVLAAVVSEHLRLPLATGARLLTLHHDVLTVARVTELGTQLLGVSLPAVVAVGADANTPRYVSLKETMQAKDRAVQLIDCAAAGIDRAHVGENATAVICREWRQRPPRTPGSMHEPACVGDAVELIVDWLDARELIR